MAAVKETTVRRVCALLLQAYGSSRLGNPIDPVDELVFISLSNQTSPAAAEQVYIELKTRFSTWDDFLFARQEEVEMVLRPSGLWRKRYDYLSRAMKKIRDDYGRVSLNALRHEKLETALAYLTSLPGISFKVARCVMMYTLDFEVLPVDIHVHRITTRLGWTAKKRPDQCHDELEILVAPRDRYAFHVGCVMHGRTVCLPRKPRCGDCCIAKYCCWRREVGTSKKMVRQSARA